MRPYPWSKNVKSQVGQTPRIQKTSVGGLLLVTRETNDETRSYSRSLRRTNHPARGVSELSK